MKIRVRGGRKPPVLRNRDLMHALECARSLLAVSIAGESKATPVEHRRRYIRTEIKLRRCLKALRELDQPEPPEAGHWIEALQAVRASALQPRDARRPDEAHRMCRQLWDIACTIERFLRRHSRS